MRDWHNITALPIHCALQLKLQNVAIANALQLEAARRRAVPILFNFVARVKFEVAQPIRCRLRAYLLLIRYVTLWPWTLTPWLWLFPLTLNICSIPAVRWSNTQTLYQIWVQSQSSNPRLSYCDLNIWPYDLEHVSRVALCSWIVCTKFKLSQAIRSWNVMIFWW